MSDKLYEDYGKLMVQKEILDNKILEVKRKIADTLNRPPIKPIKPDKKEEKK